MEQDQVAKLRRSVANFNATATSAADRFIAQVDFARGLVTLHPSKASAWNKLIDAAWKRFSDASATGDAKAALSEAEEMLAPIGKVAKDYTIHCIGHAHIDMNWLWAWPETVAITNDTFTTVLKLMDEFPDFKFSQSQGSVYDIVRVYNPEMFEQIERRVKEGRWEITAPHWVEGDKNIASGESLARHLLYTRAFFKEHFGLEPEDIPVDWEPDTFGHAHSIPSIDARGAVKYYYLCRPGETPRPAVFWWQGPDGKRVLVNREIAWYINPLPPAHTEHLVKFCKETGLKEWMLVYGVGDHGGGPTRRDIRSIIEMNTWPIFPNFKFAHTLDVFKILEKNGDKWPVLDGELNFEFSGCYTSQSAIKRINRLGENLMADTEVAATLAHRVLGREYPTKILRDNWQDVLFTHFHDILPGSGVPQTRQYTQGQFQRISAAVGMIKTHSLRALAGAIDTSFATRDADEKSDKPLYALVESTAMGGGQGRGSEFGAVTSAAHVADGPRPVVVFNPTAWERSDVITVTIWDADTGILAGDIATKKFVARASDGTTVPAQRINASEFWGHKFVELAFPVTVGPLAYSTYAIEEGSVPDFKGDVTKSRITEGGWRINLPTGTYTLENKHLRVVFDKSTGGIISLVDKKTGQDFASIDEPMGVLEYALERSAGMTAWIMGDVKKRHALEIESFDTGAAMPWEAPRSEGPHIANVIVKARINDSRLSVTFTLKANQPMLEVAINGQWLERGSNEIGIPRLSMKFPIALTNPQARYEIPFGSIERDAMNGRDVPTLRWADVTGKIVGSKSKGPSGVAVLNDSKYAYSLLDSTLRVTLIRSSFDPDPLPEMGEHAIKLAIVPHAKELSVADLVRLGAGFNHALQIVNTDVHSGTLPATLEDGVKCSADNVIVSQVKKSETDDSLIFRLFETEGKSATAKVSLSSKLFGNVESATETDLLERDLPKSTAKFSKNGFSVSVPAHGIATVRVVVD